MGQELGFPGMSSVNRAKSRVRRDKVMVSWTERGWLSRTHSDSCLGQGGGEAVRRMRRGL